MMYFATYNRLQKYIILGFILFIVLHFCFACFYSENLPGSGIIGVQIVFYVCFLLGFLVGLNLEVKALFVFISLYQIALSISLYLYFYYFVGNPLGYDPIDALLYRNMSILTMNMDYPHFLQHLKHYNNVDISDYGFPFVQRFVYMLLGKNWGLEGMIGLNILLHIVTLYYLYRLSMLLLSKWEAKLVVLLWGLNVCSVWLNVSGLKEQVFVFLIVLAMYYIYLFDIKRNIRYLLLFCCFVFAIWFFRYYVSLFLLIIFLFFILFKNLYNRFFLIYCVGIVGVVLFGLKILIYFMPELVVIEGVRAKVAEANGQNTLMYHVLSSVFAFLGPIPSFLDTPKKMNLLISVYSVWKILFSIFGLYASYWLIKKQKSQFYPLINLVLFNTLLTIVSGYALSYRYVYITMPLYLILMVYGVKLLINRKFFLATYCSFCLLASLFFNLRNF